MPNHRLDEETRQYIAVEATSPVARQQSLVARLQERQGMQRAYHPTPARPQKELIGDRWFGLRQSEAQKEHYNRALDIYYAGKEADQGHAEATRLEGRSYTRALGTVAVQEAQLLQYDPRSLTAAAGEIFLMDSIERHRLNADDANEGFRQRAFRR